MLYSEFEELNTQITLSRRISLALFRCVESNCFMNFIVRANSFQNTLNFNDCYTQTTSNKSIEGKTFLLDYQLTRRNAQSK